MDNVLAFGLVLPNGTYTDVNESSNPDLFFGLKVCRKRYSPFQTDSELFTRVGRTILCAWDFSRSSTIRAADSSEQGIVTKFTFKTYPQGQVWVSRTSLHHMIHDS